MIDRLRPQGLQDDVALVAIRHGWYVRNGAKHVWALLPRT